MRVARTTREGGSDRAVSDGLHRGINVGGVGVVLGIGSWSAASSCCTGRAPGRCSTWCRAPAGAWCRVPLNLPGALVHDTTSPSIRRPRIGSLFSGYGGPLDLALHLDEHATRCETVWFSEINGPHGDWRPRFAAC